MENIDDLTRFLDFSSLPKIQKAFRKNFDVEFGVFSTSGSDYVSIPKPCKTCSKILKQNDECCKTFKKGVLESLKNENKKVVETCPISGITLVSLPFIVNDKMNGVFYFSQFYRNNYKSFLDQKQLEKYNLDEMQIENNLKNIRLIDGDDFLSLIEFLEIMAEILSQVINKNPAISVKSNTYYDAILGIPNHKLFDSHFKNQQTVDSHIIFLNLIGIKKMNIIYGSETTNLLLRNLVNYMQEIGLYNLYRLDGDKFACLLKNTGFDSAKEIAAKIRKRFKEPWLLQKDGAPEPAYMRVRSGLFHSALINETDDFKTLADIAMQYCKDENGMIFYDYETDTNFRKKLNDEHLLLTSILNGKKGFYVDYQPVIRGTNGYWAGVEALCRFKHDEKTIDPDVFIPLVERLELIDELGMFVLEEAVKQIKELKLDLVEGFVLNVNLSPVQLNNPNLLTNINKILKKYDYPQTSLCLEITESAEVVFDEDTKKTLQEIKDSGIILALDDFGIGYSSLLNAMSLPIIMLKTDRAFLKNIENDKYLQKIFRLIIELAHESEKKVTVEGIERATQGQILIDLGADFFQGFYYSKPLSFEDLKKNVNKFISKKDYHKYEKQTIKKADK